MPVGTQNTHLPENIAAVVATALTEDIGSGDINAALIPATQQATASILTREAAVICGKPWVEEVFRQLDPHIDFKWFVQEGDEVLPNTTIVSLSGYARTLLTGERCALNFLQTLSGTATLTRRYVNALSSTHVKLLDTRKTIPGLRSAQKYAVALGGAYNHRMGLYDTYLIKENHIAAAGSIQLAVTAARTQHPDITIEVEVENFDELKQAIEAEVDIIMLDNFDLADLVQAVQITNRRAKLEVSGNITLSTLRSIAETGIDYISVGALTKNIQAIDLSMRFLFSS